ncbi:MAG: response regulator transcription factor [Anaerolineales bacterium]|nr:response regulator transcription factor [Anaerolineales bacterium]MBX3005140.1 response regulator transcription factor [Anaerolineales bacterium]MCW5886966.1 response regulator transcription factor [Anaerolineales bacterium]
MNQRILIVDDEPRFIRLIEANLQTEGYQILQAKDGKQAVEQAANGKPDLVLLDVMMPEMDGFQACERIRQFSNVPIIMLTARGEEDQRIRGLNLGADDYIVKPFSAGEMLARVRAVLRRAQTAAPESGETLFSRGSLQIDFARAEVRLDGELVSLSATEYRLLLQFAHSAGRILTAEDLLRNVWGEEYKDEKEILWVSISRLRQKLEKDPKQPELIVTHSGEGYSMP